MRSRLPKVLHPIAGRPMIQWVVQQALDLGCAPIVVVVGHGREQVSAFLAQSFPQAPLEIVVQAEQLGTAHAVRCAQSALQHFEGDVFILSGDVPGLSAETLQAFHHQSAEAAVALATFMAPEPGGYGRIVRDLQGQPTAIVEARDCTAEQRCIQEVNAGLYRIRSPFLFEALAEFSSDNAQGEFYLTDIVAHAASLQRPVHAQLFTGAAAGELSGVNDRRDLAAAEARMQARLRAQAMAQGVTFTQPHTVHLDASVQLSPDVLIEGGVSLLGQTAVAVGAQIQQGCRLVDTQVGVDCLIKAHSVLEGARLHDDVQVGPFARLREGTILHRGVRVGNFVETKKAELGPGAKAGHLSYLGDCQVGARSNIGAGTITCNYDGKHKHRTEIGEGVFIGSDTQLVAPVQVGDGAFVGAGSTVTQPVPAGALALSRSAQVNIAGWVAKRSGQGQQKQERPKLDRSNKDRQSKE